MDKAVRDFVEKSLERLRANKVQVIMLHHYQDIESYGDRLVLAMKKLRSEGLTDRIGVSVYHPSEIEAVLKLREFDAIQIPLNIMDGRPLKSGVLKMLEREKMLVFVRSVFLQGLFFKDADELPPVLQCAREYLAHLRRIADNENISVAQLAFVYVRDLPGVTSLVVGAETPEQVRQNLQLVNAPPLSEKAAAEIRKVFESVPEIILNPLKWRDN